MSLHRTKHKTHQVPSRGTATALLLLFPAPSFWRVTKILLEGITWNGQSTVMHKRTNVGPLWVQAVTLDADRHFTATNEELYITCKARALIRYLCRSNLGD